MEYNINLYWPVYEIVPVKSCNKLLNTLETSHRDKTDVIIE